MNDPIESFCPGPSVTMIAVGTEEELNFGLGGSMDKDFKPEGECEDGQS